jgi:hypothetical protein
MLTVPTSVTPDPTAGVENGRRVAGTRSWAAGATSAPIGFATAASAQSASANAVIAMADLTGRC